MGIFSATSWADTYVEIVTNENNTQDDWDQIMSICDEIKGNVDKSKEFYKAIIRRFAHSDPHVILQALNLLDVCICNCGEEFKLEVASKNFQIEYRKLLLRYCDNDHVYKRMKELIKKWATQDFNNNRKFFLIPTIYQKMRMEGVVFADGPDSPKTSLPKDPNVVISQEEEDDIIKAIELSLKSTSVSKSITSTPSSSSALYPSLGAGNSSVNGNSKSNGVNDGKKMLAEPRKVRTLYDFQAAEENELSFKAGEIIHVLEDSDQNWWKGSNHLGQGLFPSSFVTSDLSYDVHKEFEKKLLNESSTSKNGDNLKSQIGDVEETDDVDEIPIVDIDESKIDRLLHILHEVDPTSIASDSNELLSLEDQVHKMGPLIDTELEKVDRCNAELTKLSADLVAALNMYHTLMKAQQLQPPNQLPNFGNSSQTLPRNMVINQQMMPQQPRINPHRFQDVTSGGQSTSLPYFRPSMTSTLPHNIGFYPYQQGLGLQQPQQQPQRLLNAMPQVPTTTFGAMAPPLHHPHSQPVVTSGVPNSAMITHQSMNQ